MLNRETFRRALSVLALRVPTKECGSFLKLSRKWNVILKRKGFKPVVTESKDATRLVLLNPEIKSTSYTLLSDS